RQDRHPGTGCPRSPESDLHQRVRHAEGGVLPLRAHVRGGRHGLRRRRRHASGPGSLVGHYDHRRSSAVLDWMEEWLQTEWPDLRVHLTSVTDQWAAVAVVGPRSRNVVRSLFPSLSVGPDSFPFLAIRESEIGDMRVRLHRITFSGELAYELWTPSWYGLSLWEAVMAAGEPLGITPYGLGAMEILRAEKGYIIVGQDTDGTVTPKDLGMG